MFAHRLLVYTYTLTTSSALARTLLYACLLMVY